MVLKYEYKTELYYPFTMSEKDLNILGQEGWEMTGVILIDNGDIQKSILYYFKRQIN